MGSIRYISLLFIAITVGFASPPVVKNEQPRTQGNLFIIGGGKRPKALMKELVEVAAPLNYVLVMTQASGEPDTSFYYVAKQFQELTPVPIVHLDSVRIQSLTIDSILQAGLIYITGGDQNRLKRNVPLDIQAGIVRAYQNGATIAGTSAGAALMSRVMITGDQEMEKEYSATYPWLNFNNGVYAEGLGLIDSLVVDQHFVARSRYNRIISAMADNNLPLGAGIDESTALVIEADLCRVVGEGQVLIFKRPESYQNYQNRIGFINMSVSSFLPGDTLYLNTLK